MTEDEKKLMELIQLRDEARRLVWDSALMAMTNGAQIVRDEIQKAEAAILDHYRKAEAKR